jgi:Tol biopolymer transport system component
MIISHYDYLKRFSMEKRQINRSSVVPVFPLLLFFISILIFASCSTTPDIISKLINSTKKNQDVYNILYLSGSELFVHNSRTNQDSIVFSGVNTVLLPFQFSPDSTKIGMTVLCEDSLSRLLVIDTKTYAITELLATGPLWNPEEPSLLISFAWSPSGDRVCIGTYEYDIQLEKVIPGKGEIFLLDLATMEKINIGCTQSRIVEFWSPSKGIFVGDGKKWYLVSEDDCSEKIRVEDIDNAWAVNYSLAADSYTYYLPKEIFLRSEGNRRLKVWELYLVDQNAKTTLICPSVRRPKLGSEFWSPDGKMIAYEANLKGWANVPSAHYYSIETQKLRTLNYKNPVIGPDDCTNPQWSPDGTAISYTSRQPPWSSRIAVASINNDYAIKFDESGKASWLDNNRVMVLSKAPNHVTESLKVFNLSKKNNNDTSGSPMLEYSYSSPGRILFVKHILL